VDGAYRLEVVAPTARGTITMSNGLQMGVNPLPEPPASHDTLVVAGGRGARESVDDPTVVEWLARTSHLARRTASVCTGAYLVAAAGLLDGRRATTHWHFCEDLAQRYPRVQVDPDPVFIRDGDIWTSAGVTAGMDLALALVEEDLGPRVAAAVARQLFVDRPDRAGQAPRGVSLLSRRWLRVFSHHDRVGDRHDLVDREIGE
jgi:transcriptional regulator GlxA family with amidase domain